MPINYGAYDAGFKAMGSGAQGAQLLSDILNMRRQRQQDEADRALREKMANYQTRKVDVPGYGPMDQAVIPYLSTLARTTAKSSAGGSGERGIAALVKLGFPTTAANRIQTVPNALELHNAMIEVQNAYNDIKQGNVNRAQAALKAAAASNRWLTPFIGGQGLDEDNLTQVYETLRTQAAMEIPKLTSGGTKTLTKDEVDEYKTLYFPNLGTDPGQAQAKFSAYAMTQIMPAIIGAKNSMDLINTPSLKPEAKAFISEFGQNLEGLRQRTEKQTKRLVGTYDSVVPSKAAPFKRQAGGFFSNVMADLTGGHKDVPLTSAPAATEAPPTTATATPPVGGGTGESATDRLLRLRSLKQPKQPGMP